MIKLPEPYAEKDSGFVGEILACCAEGYTKSPNKQAQLRACRDAVIAISKVYRESMPDNIAAVITAADKAIECNAVAGAYKDKFAKKGAPGREYYDHILYEGLRHGAGFCPICEIGRPSELDHYLPKSSFPALAVTPSNLVPICSECNKVTRKGAYSPNTQEDSLYHPYFEDPPSCIWLIAEISFGQGLCIDYGVEPLDPICHRLEQMMTVYGLGERYGVRAVELLYSKRAMHIEMLELGGIDELKSEFLSLRDSARAYRLNGWDAALWSAAVRQVDQYAEWLKTNTER